jgi:hypothetical protein
MKMTTKTTTGRKKMTGLSQSKLRKDTMLRRHALERLALRQRHARERKLLGMEPIEPINFDSLVGTERIWHLGHPNGEFNVCYVNGNLHLEHIEAEDAGGMAYSEELKLDALDTLRAIIGDFRDWRNGPRIVGRLSTG